jgi:hypothetical protein
MGQYTPLHQAPAFEPLSRPLTADEYEQACSAFSAAQLEGYIQEFDRLNQAYIIDFTTRTQQRLLDRDDISHS